MPAGKELLARSRLFVHFRHFFFSQYVRIINQRKLNRELCLPGGAVFYLFKPLKTSGCIFKCKTLTNFGIAFVIF